MSADKDRKSKRSRPADGARSQRAGRTPQERGKFRSMLEYEGVTRSRGAKKREEGTDTNDKRERPRSAGKSKLRALFEYEGVTRQEARTKEALRESEQKLRVILDSIAAGVTITDLEGSIIEMNSGALRLHGFSSKEEVIGRNGLELIAEKDRGRAINNWKARFEGDSAKEVSDHYTLLKADGTEFEAAASESLLRDKYGQPEGFITIARDITERKRAEELVRASEAKLRAMFESIEDAVTIVDLEGNIVEVNDVMCRMGGYRREDIIGKSGWDIIDPRYRDTIVNDLMKQLKGEAPKEAPVYKFSTADGREYYAELHVSVIRDDSGKATGFLTIHNDITERMRMQQALRESEELARGMLESAATGIYLVQDRVFQYVSPLFTEISGYDSSELIGTDPLGYVHPEDRESVRRKAVENLKGHSNLPHEFRFMRKNGEPVWVLEKVASIEYGGKRAAIASFMDITEQKRAEAELEKSAEKLRIIIESIGDMLFVTDLELNFVNVNDAAVRLLGYGKEDDLVGKSAVECIAEKDRSRVAVDMGKALAAQSGVETLEYTLITAGGSELEAESNIDILRDCSGMVVGLIITARDVTERKRMQEAVRASEEKLRIMFESIRDGIVVTDPLGTIIQANEATAAMTGYPREKLIGMNGLELISPEYHQMAAEVMGKVMEGKQATGSLELKFVTADGGEIDAEFSTSMLYDGDGNATGFVSIARDIGERKRMEAELEKSAEKLRLVIESIGDMLFITDLDLNFSNVNEAAARQLGYATQEELAGKNAMESVAEEDRTRVAIELGKALAEERGIDTIGYSLQAADGRRFDVEANAEILRDCSGQVVGLILSARDVTERKRMQEAIRNSEEKLRGIFDTIPDGVTFTDMTGSILDLNEAMVRMYGHSDKEELIGRNAIDFVAEGYRDTVVLLGMNAIKEGHNIESIEYRMRRADGTEFDAEFFSAPLRDTSGEPVAWVNVSRDITGRKQAERAVRESEKRFRTIFESIVDGLTVTDLGGNIVDMNEAALQLHGYEDKQELIGKSTIEYLVAEVDRERTIKEALEAIKQDRPLARAEYRLQRGDGTEFEGEFSTAILRDDDGKVSGHIGMTRDITERKRADEAVRESEENLRAMFDSVHDGIILIDTMGNMQRMNQAALKMTGYTEEDLIGKSALDFVYEEDRDKVAADMGTTFESNHLVDETPFYRLVRKDGSMFEAELGTGILHDAEGNITGFVGVMRDVTERRQAEEAIRQSEEKLRLMFESMRDAIILTDTTGTIVEVNDAAVSMHGYTSRDDIIGKNGLDLVAESDRKKVAEVAMNQAKGETSEGLVETHMLLRADGTEFESESSRAILRDAEGNTTGFIAVERDISERRQMEEQVRDIAQKLRAMFDSMNDAATIVDLTSNIVDVNEAAVRLHGYGSREEMIGMPGADLIAERERESVVKYTMKAVEKGTTHERKECTLLKADGTEFDAEMSFSVLYDKDGNLESFLTLSQDITERKRAAQALEQSEARFRALVENMSSAVAVYEVKNKGRDFIFKDLNSAGEKISQLKKEDILDRNLVDVFPNIKNGPIYPAMKRVWKTGKPEHIPPALYSDDRISGWRENYIYKLPTGEVVAVYDDVSERMEAEEALRQSEEKLRLTFENMGDGITVTDLEGKIIEVNDVQLRMSGYSREEFIGRDGWDIISYVDRDRVINDVMNALKGEAPEQGLHYKFVNKDGSEYDAELRASILRDGSGTPIGFITTVRNITERLRAEEALRESEEKLRLMFESTSDGIIITDTGLTIIDTNEAAPNLLGFESKEELIGKSAIPFMSGKKEAGTELHTEFSVSQLRDNEGNTIGFIGICRDITERIKAEEAIRESGEKLRTMFESTNDSFIVTDAETTVVDVNEATLRTFGYSREELIGKKGFDLIAPEDLEKAVGPMTQALETGQPLDRMELSILCGDGRKLQTDFSISALHDNAGKITGFVAAARDITERKRAEQAMRESEEKLRTMFESTSDGILVTDQTLKIAQANEAAARMLGFASKEALVGQSALQYMSTGSQTVAEEGGNGKVQIEFSVSQLRDNEGNTTGFIGVARDVTERKRAEAQMKRMLEELSRSNAELEQFAYIASHDLQEPLRMISSYTQLLARRYKGKLDADGEEFIEYAVDGATRMQDRIQALLTYSRVGTRGKEFEPVNCEEVLNEALSNLQVSIKKSNAVITHDPLPTVPADDTQLVQLFQNLLENGMKFCDKDHPEVHISATEQDEDWLFSFRDNGIGIDPQYSERIFLIFKRLHAKGEYAGTGVGLALCKKIVERHGGRIWVESEPDKGATFCFTIPKERKEED